MKLMLRLCLVLLLLATSLHAARDVDDVRNVRRILPGSLWSKPVEITNSQPDPVYPKHCYGLAFEFGGVLWLYTPYDGTQSLSQSRGTSEADKARLAELLLGVHPGFKSHVEIATPTADLRPEDPIPRNACFILSIRAAHCPVLKSEEFEDAALLSYYYADSRRSGHTVLTFKTRQGCFVLDPTVSAVPVKVEGRELSDPVSFARAIQPETEIAKARFFRVKTLSSRRA